MQKLFLFIAVVFLFTSCEHILTEGNNNNSIKYPSKAGNEWEYNTTWKIEFYDTLGHIDSSSFKDFGNTIVRITKEIDTVGNYTNLIRFETFDLGTVQNINTMWYLNSDTGFYSIAYQNPGSTQVILPKQGNLTFEQVKSFIKSIGLLPANQFAVSSYPLNDSIQYYPYPRKVLAYPVAIGAKWTELLEPFYRERYINTQQIMNVNGKSYYCFKVESGAFLTNFKLVDYVDMNSGLIMREVIADSLLLHILSDSAYSTGYYKYTSISKLVGITKP